jgi:hypothetical protein
MNDFCDARQRYESGSVQYLARLLDAPTPAGGVARIRIILQNVMDVPVDVRLVVHLPDLNRKLRRLPQPLFQVFEPEINLPLANGEAAELIIPVRVHPPVPAGEYPFAIQVLAQPQHEGMRVRPEQGENRVGEIKIQKPQGLGISQIASWGYETKKSERQTLTLIVGAPGEVPEEVDLKPQFQSLWVPEDWDLIASARREANDRRIYAVPELTAKALYLPLMEESQAAFGDCGVRLHVGEAIFVAKMLTFTATYFMSNNEWQDCLLVPIYAYAQASDSPTDDAVWLVTQLGYTHVVELAIALSFVLIAELLEREPWAQEEQVVVREFIVGSLLEGGQLPTEFVYLPLILGGMCVADEIVFEGEQVSDSLRILAQAKDQRGELFAEEDLRPVGDAFDRLLAKKVRQQR